MAYWLPTPDPSTLNPYGVYGYNGFGGYSPYSGGVQNSSQNWGTAVGQGGVDVNPDASMEDIFSSNRNLINTLGNTIGQTAGNQLNYYGPLQVQNQLAQNSALNQLLAQPGYNAQQAGVIGQDYSRFNTSPDALQGQYLTGQEQAGIYGDPYSAAQNLQGGLGAEGAFLNQYQSNLGGQLGNLDQWLGAASGQFGQSMAQGAQDFASGVGGAAAGQLSGVRGAEAAMGGRYQGALSGMQSGVNSALGNYGSNISGAIGQYGSDISGALGQYGRNLQNQLSGMTSGVRGGVSDLGTGLQDAQGKFGALDKAVQDPSLQFDPSGTEKQLTDADVQEMRTAAGVSAGNQFRTAEDTLERQAAQAGNTSPLALAAARERLATQQAATAGDVENQAEIAAKQAQYERAAGIESQRFGTAATRQGMQATAATTEEAAAQAAAGLYGQSEIGAEMGLGTAGLGALGQYGQSQLASLGQLGQSRLASLGQLGQTSTAAQLGLGNAALGAAQGMSQAQLAAELGLGNSQIGAQESIGQAGLNARNAAGQMQYGAASLAGQAGLNAANQYGQFSTNQANTMTAQQYQALLAAEQMAQARNQYLAGNRQSTLTGINNTQYQQGMQGALANSQGQQILGQAEQQGMSNYRSGVAQQQGMAQQGGQAAMQNQVSTYGTQTSGLNTNAGNQASFEVSKPSFGDAFLGNLGANLGATIGSGGRAPARTTNNRGTAKGGVITSPETRIVGESGPELVVQLGKYKSKMPKVPNLSMGGGHF